MEIRNSQQKKIEKLFKKHEVIFAYLFGSQANGTAIKSSDVDIAVMFNDKVGKDERFKTRLVLMTELSKIFNNIKTEVVSLNDMNDIFFKYIIIQSGKIIYNQDHGARLNYEVKTVGEYYDFEPFIERYNKAFAKRVLVN